MVRRRLTRLGREGNLGLMLLVICVTFYMVALRPAETRLAGLRAEVAAQRRAMVHAPAVHRARRTPEQQLAHYYNGFPARHTTPVWLGKIYKAALDQHLQLDKGEYRAKPETSGKLVHYRIILPVKGTYLQLRKFIAAVLTNVPTAALDQLSLDRPHIKDSMIDARVTLTLYLGPRP